MMTLKKLVDNLCEAREGKQGHTFTTDDGTEIFLHHSQVGSLWAILSHAEDLFGEDMSVTRTPTFTLCVGTKEHPNLLVLDLDKSLA